MGQEKRPLAGVEGQEVEYRYQDEEGKAMRGKLVGAALAEGETATALVAFFQARADEFDADLPCFNRALNTLEVR